MEKSASENAPAADDIEAVGAVVKALRPFKDEVRQRIVESALTLLGGATQARYARAPHHDAAPEVLLAPARQDDSAPVAPRDIREFRNRKQPRTAIQMATLAAYYLSKLAPPELRQDFITPSDVTKYFEQAGFLQPSDPGMTLVNGKYAGYFDSLGEGRYRLNPVGLNLVTHGLPRKTEGGGAPRMRPRRKSRPPKSGNKPNARKR